MMVSCGAAAGLWHGGGGRPTFLVHVLPPHHVLAIADCLEVFIVLGRSQMLCPRATTDESVQQSNRAVICCW